MKMLLIAVLGIVLIGSLVHGATLGAYEAGETLTYSVVCLTDAGAKDIGCSASDDDILDPDDTTAKSPTTALAEVSDASFPGLWRGNYTVPTSPHKGTWSIFVEMTNSNGTLAATVLNFEVENATIAEQVWSYNVSASAHKSSSGYAAWFMDQIKTAVDWIERLM